jgi:hypothetical protein
MRPAPVKLLTDYRYDVTRLRFWGFVGGWLRWDGECLNWADWFDPSGCFTGPQAEGVEPVFEATSVFPRE